MNDISIVIPDFALKEKPSSELKQKYANSLPIQVPQMWEKYGFGTSIGAI